MRQIQAKRLAVRALTLILTAAAFLGCGDHETMASRSARGFREAQSRGERFAGEGHAHGHDAAPAADARDQGHPGTTGAETGEPHVEHGQAEEVQGMTEPGAGGTGDHAQGAAAEHGKHGHPEQPQADPPAHARSGAPQHATSSMRGHQRPESPAAAPGSHAHGGDAAMSPPLVSSVSAPAGAPAIALAPDAVDAPAATSVAEALRAAETGSTMGGMKGTHAHGATGYRQRDAGRAPAAEDPPRPHEQHSVPAPGADRLPGGGREP